MRHRVGAAEGDGVGGRGQGGAAGRDGPAEEGGGAAYPQQVLHQEAGVRGEDGRQRVLERQGGGGGGGPVQARVEGGGRDHAWDHHGPGFGIDRV